ncbi:hypothetical protein [Kushneria marisflavi]|uniref:hypothetical protein n=1 Tax=Kushneria marisflavi TaxID=157779 RepID=UPI000FED9B64|nr:hypothetical protein [Kushneria marisflavi]RKD75783.1 hypothetical protein C8D96_3357 [Kushneria marisflavi]
MQQVQLTSFTAGKRLTKEVTVKDDGSLSRKSAILSSALAERVDVSSAQEFADLIENLEQTQCLAYGVTQRLQARIGSGEYLKQNEIPRCRDTFDWPNSGGILYIDFDGKYSPDDVSDLRDRLTSAMPQISTAPQVWTRSSSSGIVKGSDEPTRGGLHCYILVDDASQLQRIGEHLHNALWLAGEGFHILSKGDHPAALERCLIDASVFQPERLDYAAAPVLGEGLTRPGGTVIAVFNNEKPFMSAQSIKPLTDEQEAEVARLKRESRETIKPTIQKARRKILESLPAPQRETRRLQFVAADRGEITTAHLLHFSDGKTVTAGAVLADLPKYAGKRLADPLEPAYGDDPRIAMVTDQGAIYSHAHGGQRFRIVGHVEAAPDVVEDIAATDKEIVSACYQHRIYSTGEGLQAVCEATGATPERVEHVFQRHTQDKALPLHRDGKAKRVNTFDDALAMIGEGKSAVILAALGSGKTEKIGRHVMANANRAVSVTVLRALVESHTAAFGSTHYSERAELLAAAPRMSTTVHSLDKMPLDGFGAGDVVLLDEFAAIAGLLYDTHESRILSAAKQVKVMDTLRDLCSRGVQFVALDGDMTPTAARLAQELGMSCISVEEQPHTPPRVDVVAHEEQGFHDHSRIIELLNKGERVVIATDSKDRAETWGHELAAYKPLVIHGDNSECDEQAAFLSNPQEQAPKHKLVIYSPAVGVGVSVTSVKAHVFVFQHSGTTGADGMWQSARRFRIAEGNAIRWHVSQNLCRPQRAGLSRTSIKIDVVTHANALGRIDDTIPGVIASHYQRSIFDANPLYATVGHLLNIGLDVSVNTMSIAEAKDEAKIARDAVKMAKVERIATAGPVADNETLKRTPADKARGDRQHIEQALGLTREDGSLDREIVRQVTEERLITRVERLASVHARSLGVDLAAKDAPEGFAFMSHRNKQADIVLEIIDGLKDSKGRIAVNATTARAVAQHYRPAIHVAYGDISKPQAKGSNTQYSRWLRDLLNGWGFECEESVKVNGNRTYYYRPAPEVAKHIGKVLKRMKGESVLLKNAVNS